MTARVLVFVLCLAAGTLAGWMLHPVHGALPGLAAGSLLWFVLESSRGARVLRWLRLGQLRGAPNVGGWWGEAAERARRAIQARQQEVDDAQRRLEGFLEAIRNSPNGVVLLDPQGRIEWCNQTAARHLGLDPERDLLQQIVNLLRDPGFTAFYHSGNYAQDVTVAAPGSTSSRPQRLSLFLHPYGEGRRLLLTRDVTAVEQAEAMRRDFVANVSHELRTPLTVLAGFVETLQTLDLSGQEQSHYLGLMGQQAQRMQTLVNDLLMLSRLEGSPPPGDGDWTPAAAFVAQCEQEARALAATLGKQLQFEWPQAPPFAFSGVAAEWQSAFSNLVGNAVRYTPSGGAVQLRVEPEESGRVAVRVRDTGPGIAAEHLPRLTERFYRVDRSRSRESGGTGLGLAIVKHVVQRHGGELKIESTVGAGSTFTILVPAARVRPQAVTPPGSGARPATESAAG